MESTIRHKVHRQLSILTLILSLLIGVSACAVGTQDYPTVFALGSVDSGFEISALNLNTGVRQYITNSKVIAPMSFDYCSKEKQIAYSAPVENGEEIILYGLNSAARALTSGNNRFRFPAWSPDCSLIAANSLGEPQKIALIQINDGSTKTLFPNANRSMQGFSWSPSGRYAVTFTTQSPTQENSTFDLSVIDIENETEIQDINGEIDYPFSKIAWFDTDDGFLFVAKRQGNFDIYKHSIINREDTPMVQTENDDRYPVLSPNEKFLVFLQSAVGGASFSINLLDLSSNSTSVLLSTPMNVDSLLWIDDHEILITEIDQSVNQTNFYSFNIDKKSLKKLASFQGRYKNPKIFVQN
jgi:Tol biopolymer transport system component